ncbi:MAG TPA: hypothetical protein VLU24_01470, partial [Mycobacterium sp.]|nr:hypothetical protein [Mycobacterium sp.]
AECRQLLKDGPTVAGADRAISYDVVTQFNDRGVPLKCLATLVNCPKGCSSGISLDGFTCGVLFLGSADGGSG